MGAGHALSASERSRDRPEHPHPRHRTSGADGRLLAATSPSPFLVLRGIPRVAQTSESSPLSRSASGLIGPRQTLRADMRQLIKGRIPEPAEADLVLLPRGAHRSARPACRAAPSAVPPGTHEFSGTDTEKPPARCSDRRRRCFLFPEAPALFPNRGFDSRQGGVCYNFLCLLCLVLSLRPNGAFLFAVKLTLSEMPSASTFLGILSQNFLLSENHRTISLAGRQGKAAIQPLSLREEG